MQEGAPGHVSEVHRQIFDHLTTERDEHLAEISEAVLSNTPQTSSPLMHSSAENAPHSRASSALERVERIREWAHSPPETCLVCCGSYKRPLAAAGATAYVNYKTLPQSTPSHRHMQKNFKIFVEDHSGTPDERLSSTHAASIASVWEVEISSTSLNRRNLKETPAQYHPSQRL